MVGKPAPAVLRAEVLRDLGVDATQAAMVGGRHRSPTSAARCKPGSPGILVQTGKHREEAVRASGIEPAATVATMRGKYPPCFLA